MTHTDSDKPAIREAVGAFANAEQVHAAVTDLVAAGFGEGELGLLTSEDTVRRELSESYIHRGEAGDIPDGPNTLFVARNSVGDTIHAMVGGLGFAGTTVAGGVAVASGAVLGGGLIAAAAGVAAVAAMGTALALIVRESDAEELEQQVDEGHLLLFVRTRDADHEQLAVDILGRHSPIEARVVSAPA